MTRSGRTWWPPTHAGCLQALWLPGVGTQPQVRRHKVAPGLTWCALPCPLLCAPVWLGVYRALQTIGGARTRTSRTRWPSMMRRACRRQSWCLDRCTPVHASGRGVHNDSDDDLVPDERASPHLVATLDKHPPATAPPQAGAPPQASVPLPAAVQPPPCRPHNRPVRGTRNQIRSTGVTPSSTILKFM